MVAELAAGPLALEKIANLFANEAGYQTPKVDVRAVLFRGADEVLLVRETLDGSRWTLPGGWADVGLTPFEVAEKEAHEETGLRVRAGRLLALFDKKRHATPAAALVRVQVLRALRASRRRPAGRDFRNHRRPLGAGRRAFRTLVCRLTVQRLRSWPRFRTFARQPDKPTLCD